MRTKRLGETPTFITSGIGSPQVVLETAGRTSCPPESNGKWVLYWFEQVRHADKGVELIPYVIDDNPGAGTQVAIADVNGDGLPDIVIANMKSAFVFIQDVKNVSLESR